MREIRPFGSVGGAKLASSLPLSLFRFYSLSGGRGRPSHNISAMPSLNVG